jgi:hypothetical protein
MPTAERNRRRVARGPGCGRFVSLPELGSPARAAKQYGDSGCPDVATETVALFYGRIDAVRADFAKIAAIYK